MPFASFMTREISFTDLGYLVARSNGKAINKDINCRKLRCGCGRRFKKDYERKNDTCTYRCYELVEDGCQERRKERSYILQDNCCIYGIRDWKLDLFTLRVFEYLECNVDEIKEQLLEIINSSFIENDGVRCQTGEIAKEIEKLKEKNERLLDAYLEKVLSKEDYVSRKTKNDTEIEKKLILEKKMEDKQDFEKQRNETLQAVKDYLNQVLTFPSVNGVRIRVPEVLIDTYVNSIKACADNVFEYNIRINPEAPIQIPNVSDEEFNPQIHSATNIIDNSSAELLAEFTIDYDEAKEYANSRKRKVSRVHFDKPAIIRIYANII